MNVFLVLIVYLLIVIFDMIPLIKKRQIRDIVPYSLIFFSAFVLSMVIALGIKLPSTAGWIGKAVEFIVGKRTE